MRDLESLQNASTDIKTVALAGGCGSVDGRTDVTAHSLALHDTVDWTYVVVRVQ